MSHQLTVLFAVLLVLIFLCLALIHFYWAMGGQWGFDHSLPTDETNKRFFTPKPFDCMVVGTGLLAFSIYFLLKSGLLFTNPNPNWIMINGGWFISAVFLLRAIGDFNYAGFFKKIKSTNFAYWDSRLFSPLCLFISILGFWIQITQLKLF